MNKKAYTLMEIVISVAIAGIVAGVFAIVINAGMENWFLLKGQKRIMMETRAAMQRMLREIRITRDTSDTGILNFTSTRYRFRDINNNTIDYQRDGSDLERNNRVLLENLAASGGLEFVYLDASGETTAVRGNIRSVRVTLIVQEGDNRVRLRSAASIRNR